MLNKIGTFVIAFSLVANAECFGEKFFKERSSDFVPGLSNICFQSSVEDVVKNIVPKELSSELDKFKEYKNLSEQKIWIDSTSIGNWFNDGGSCCFANMYYKNYTSNSELKVIGTPPAYKWGVRSVFVGNKSHGDTSIAFTFYTGKSNSFYREERDNKYAKTSPIRGLFEVTVFVNDVQEKYFAHKLDSLGYGRPCPGRKYNCTTEHGGNEYRTITWVNTKDVIVIFDPLNHKVHIRLTSNISSLADAMRQNLKILYDEKTKSKFSRLDE